MPLLREVSWRILVMCRAGGHVIVKAEYRKGPGLCVLLWALGWHRGRGGVWPDRHVFGRPESVAGFGALLLSVSEDRADFGAPETGPWDALGFKLPAEKFCPPGGPIWSVHQEDKWAGGFVGLGMLMLRILHAASQMVGNRASGHVPVLTHARGPAPGGHDGGDGGASSSASVRPSSGGSPTLPAAAVSSEGLVAPAGGLCSGAVPVVRV